MSIFYKNLCPYAYDRIVIINLMPLLADVMGTKISASIA